MIGLVLLGLALLVAALVVLVINLPAIRATRAAHEARLAARRAALQIPPRPVTLRYEGGHPEWSVPPAGESVQVWTANGCVNMADQKLARVVSMPRHAVASVSLQRDVQNVAVGGGSSLGGALVGGVMFGGAGAIVGSRKKDKIKKVDESRTYMVVKYNGLDVQLAFVGGQATYAQLSGVVAQVRPDSPWAPLQVLEQIPPPDMPGKLALPMMLAGVVAFIWGASTMPTPAPTAQVAPAASSVAASEAPPPASSPAPAVVAPAVHHAAVTHAVPSHSAAPTPTHAATAPAQPPPCGCKADDLACRMKCSTK